jgi:NADH:ubiquinone oxidoreductase subunit 5 (subunit L)/multisubunit Na+/H+ antiporter MnhA subunit
VVRNALYFIIYKTFDLIRALFYILFYVIYVLVYTVIPFLVSCIAFIFKCIKQILSPITPVCISWLVKIINWFLFFFGTIPLWFFHEFLKVLLLYLKKVLKNYFFRYMIFSYELSLIPAILLDFCKFLVKVFILLLKFFKNITTDFLYFDLYRNRVFLLDVFVRMLSWYIHLYIIYLLLYINLWGVTFNYIFSKLLESLVIWNIDTYKDISFIILWALNLDNAFLVIYVLVIKIGLSFILVNDPKDVFIKVWDYWQVYYVDFKKNNENFSFFRYVFDETYEKLPPKLDLYSFYYMVEIDESIPFFFIFGSLFFFTVILSWLFLSHLGLYGVYKLNVITLFLFWVSLLFSAKFILINQKIYIIKFCSWVFLTTNFKIDCYFLIDTIAFSFILLITTISLFVYIYAFAYFRYEPLVDRFLLFILFFVISMIFLVASGNTIMLFLGWELIGFTSFCLINFWTTKVATLKSAFKAFSFNKFSDCFMFIFLISTYNIFYTFDIYSLNNQLNKYEFTLIYIFELPFNYLEFTALILMSAAFIKSAQICGHVWLPDSMEAPVPASSLIHSATLVSAGVYLVLRFNHIFDATQYGKFIIPIIGSLTAAYGGVCAAAQSDIKKTLAYSTISHCGFLMVLCATEMNEFTILYLYVHGFFKAVIFMCVGNVLRITRGCQDSRKMGGLLKHLPFEYFCLTISFLNLAGLPFTFGFCIKHLLLINLGTHVQLYSFVMFNSLLGAFSGLFYSFRILNYTFVDFKKGFKILYVSNAKLNYNSVFYSNSALASTFAICGLYFSAYVIIYFLLKFFMEGNYIFSDYMNNTVLTNYYAALNNFDGFLLNFSYINIIVLSIILALYFSRFRKLPRFFTLINTLSSIFILYIFWFIFIFIVFA